MFLYIAENSYHMSRPCCKISVVLFVIPLFYQHLWWNTDKTVTCTWPGQNPAQKFRKKNTLNLVHFWNVYVESFILLNLLVKPLCLLKQNPKISLRYYWLHPQTNKPGHLFTWRLKTPSKICLKQATLLSTHICITSWIIAVTQAHASLFPKSMWEEPLHSMLKYFSVPSLIHLMHLEV